MINHRLRHVRGAVRAVLVSGAVLASVLVGSSPVGAQDGRHDLSNDLTVTETPAFPGVVSQGHFEASGWVPYGDGFANMVRNADLNMETQFIDRDGRFIRQAIDFPGDLEGELRGLAINDRYMLIETLGEFPTQVSQFDRQTSDLLPIVQRATLFDFVNMSSDGQVVYGYIFGTSFWVEDFSVDPFNIFDSFDNNISEYLFGGPVIDAGGTFIAVAALQNTPNFDVRPVVEVKATDGASPDEVIVLTCPAANCEYEITGITATSSQRHIYVSTFALDAGQGSPRVSATHGRILTDLTAGVTSAMEPSVPVAVISPNGRLFVGNPPIDGSPELSASQLAVFDTETNSERVITISGLDGGQVATPLSVSDDGLFVQYRAEEDCLFEACVGLPSYVGWFELDAPSPVTRGPAEDEILRLYRAVFGRLPDVTGFQFWTGQYQIFEQPLVDIAAEFERSPEFADRFGVNPTNEELVAALYRNTLGRDGDAAGIQFWLDELRDGTSIAQLLVQFANSPENIERTATRQPITVGEGRVLRLYRSMLGREPDAGGLAFWLGEYNRGVAIIEIARQFQGQPEYTALYGADPTNAELIDAVYLNVLGRAGDPDGVAYWLDLLGDGVPVPQLFVSFANSIENIENTGTVG